MNYSLENTHGQQKEYFFSSPESEQEKHCIGHLRGDFDTGELFYTTWWPHNDQLKSEEFKAELDDVVNALRKKGEPLCNLNTMSNFCFKNTDSLLQERAYGFKFTTQHFTYYFRFSPYKGDYNFYIYCYTNTTKK